MNCFYCFIQKGSIWIYINLKIRQNCFNSMPSQNSCQLQPQPQVQLQHHQQQASNSIRISQPASSYGITNGSNNGIQATQSITNKPAANNHSVNSNHVTSQSYRPNLSIPSSTGSSLSTIGTVTGTIASFDPNDEDSWFFGPMSRADATELLSKNNEIGSFLVRESTSQKLDLVLTVKDGEDKVSHYIINRFITDNNPQQVCFKIGEQVFIDLPSLLAYYKVNNLDDTPLKVPASSKDSKILKKSFSKDYITEVIKDCRMRISPKLDNCQRAGPALTQRNLPCLAKVIQSRIPNAYDKTALTLKEGDIINVTKVDICGSWEGEIGDRQGHFPFNYVEFLDEVNN